MRSTLSDVTVIAAAVAIPHDCAETSARDLDHVAMQPRGAFFAWLFERLRAR